MKRVHLIISGHVQDVGFRAWFCEQASKLSLSGWVKNRADGTVEAVAEGNEEKLNKLIELARTGPEVAQVENVRVKWQEAPGRFSSFDIAF